MIAANRDDWESLLTNLYWVNARVEASPEGPAKDLATDGIRDSIYRTKFLRDNPSRGTRADLVDMKRNLARIQQNSPGDSLLPDAIEKALLVLARIETQEVSYMSQDTEEVDEVCVVALHAAMEILKERCGPACSVRKLQLAGMTTEIAYPVAEILLVQESPLPYDQKLQQVREMAFAREFTTTFLRGMFPHVPESDPMWSVLYNDVIDRVARAVVDY